MKISSLMISNIYDKYAQESRQKWQAIDISNLLTWIFRNSKNC